MKLFWFALVIGICNGLLMWAQECMMREQGALQYAHQPV